MCHNKDGVMLLQYRVVKQKVFLKGNKEREVEKCHSKSEIMVEVGKVRVFKQHKIVEIEGLK